MPLSTSHQEITLVVQEAAHDAIDSWQLTMFLYHFRAVYGSAVMFHRFHSSLDNVVRDYELQESFRRSIRLPMLAVPEEVRNQQSEQDRLSGLFSRDWGEDELLISQISFRSPLEITCVCLASALTAAVIVSGGKATFMGFRFTLPSLGSGIKSLRDAFRLPAATRSSRLPTRRDKT